MLLNRPIFLGCFMYKNQLHYKSGTLGALKNGGQASFVRVTERAHVQVLVRDQTHVVRSFQGCVPASSQQRHQIRASGARLALSVVLLSHCEAGVMPSIPMPTCVTTLHQFDFLEANHSICVTTLRSSGRVRPLTANPCDDGQRSIFLEVKKYFHLICH